jgi:hypothetical protein
MEKISEVLIESTGQTVKLEGEKGTTFTPSVDANGNLSWTNDGGKQNPTTVNIKGERGEKGDTTVIDPSTATVYTLYNQTGNHTDGAMTQAAVTEEFEKLDEVYARNDGYYESMGVGMATNLKGQNVVDAEFTYRKSGGNVEVQDGNAMIEAIKGNTIAWNQIVNSLSGASEVYGITRKLRGYALHYSGTSTRSTNFSGATMSIAPINTHKYYLSVKGIPNTCGISKNYAAGADSYVGTLSETSFGVYIPEGVTIDADVYFACIDLTLIYGEGNEPATVEQFEQDYFNWFGKPLTYEPYDAGSLRNTKVSALKTTGFNQWDEEWENGFFINGVPSVSENIRSKNFIRAFAGESYYSNKRCFFSFYDANKNSLSTNYRSVCEGTPVIAPSGTCYMKFFVEQGYGTTYNHDICINISDPNRNGEYEPHKESTLPLDVTTLTGKLNGEGSSVVVFPNGMEQGDEITIADGVVKAIRRRKVVDMSTLSIEYNQQYSFFFAYFENILPHVKHPASIQTFKSGLYNNIGSASTSALGSAPTLSLAFYNESSYEISSVRFKNLSYNSVSEFKAAMQGVMLSYELTEPEVYVLDDFNLPKLYPVANGGTEEQLSNAQNSLPATLSIRYGLNAAAFIQNAPKNYISKESMTNFLSNLGSAMGGTWSMTWNSSTNKYDFSFTQNRSVDVEQPIEDK